MYISGVTNIYSLINSRIYCKNIVNFLNYNIYNIYQIQCMLYNISDTRYKLILHSIQSSRRHLTNMKVEFHIEWNDL